MPPDQTGSTVPSAPIPVEPVQPPPSLSPVISLQPIEVQQPVVAQSPMAPVVETAPEVAVQENLPPTTLPQVEAPQTYVEPAPQIMFEGEAPIQQIQSKGMMQWIIANSSGTIKDEKQAMTALLGFAGVAVVFSLYLIFFTGPSTPPPPPIMDDSFVPATKR